MAGKDKQHGGNEQRGKPMQDDARERSRNQPSGKPHDTSHEPRPDQRMDDDGAPRAQPTRPGGEPKPRDTAIEKKPTYGDQEPDDPRRLDTEAGDSKRAPRQSGSTHGREGRD